MDYNDEEAVRDYILECHQDLLPDEYGYSLLQGGMSSDTESRIEKARESHRAKIDALLAKKEKYEKENPGKTLKESIVPIDEEINQILQTKSANNLDDAYDQLIEEQGETLKINRCPQCKKVLRAPKAQQCPHCKHKWHGEGPNLIALDWKWEG